MHSVKLIRSLPMCLIAVLLLSALGSAAYVPHANGFVSNQAPAGVAAFSSTAHVFKHKVVYIDSRRCDLVCERAVCRYCTRSASHVIKPAYGSCFSPTRSVAIDKEYTVKLSTSSSGYVNAGRFGSFPMHISGSSMHSNGRFASSNLNGFFASPSKYPTGMRSNGVFGSSPYVFKNKFVVINSQRCELVCRYQVCQYCPLRSQHWNTAPAYGTCFSPRHSMAIDMEYGKYGKYASGTGCDSRSGYGCANKGMYADAGIWSFGTTAGSYGNGLRAHGNGVGSFGLAAGSNGYGARPQAVGVGYGLGGIANDDGDGGLGRNAW